MFMENALIVSDYHTLLALHKIIIEAKFPENPSSTEIPGSPFLAQVSNQIVEILIQKEKDLGKESAIMWQKWREIDENRREWYSATQYLIFHKDIWTTWDRHQQEDFVHTLLSPFIIQPELLDAFINSINNATDGQ
jgi:hypothetical protein